MLNCCDATIPPAITTANATATAATPTTTTTTTTTTTATTKYVPHMFLLIPLYTTLLSVPIRTLTSEWVYPIYHPDTEHEPWNFDRRSLIVYTRAIASTVRYTPGTINQVYIHLRVLKYVRYTPGTFSQVNMYLIFVPRLHYVHQVHNGNQVPCGPPAALRGVFYCSSKGLYRCRRTIGHFTVGEFTVTGVQLFLFAFLVNSWDIDRKTERRWLGTPPCDIPLRKTAIRAYEGKSSELIPPGPRSRVGTCDGRDDK